MLVGAPKDNYKDNQLNNMSKKELMVPLSEESLAILRESYPVEQGFNRILLPRLGMISQDKTEGKGKAMKVVAEAGTFFIEKQTEELDEEGKKKWDRTELGTEIEAIIIYQRKQLRLYDEATEQYTSSPIYDTDEDVIPLFCDKKEIARGTPQELKAKYQYTGDDGKTRSKLEDNRILYVMYDTDVYQLNLRGSSMYSFLTYARKTMPPSVLTKFSSEAKEKGSIQWNQMIFEPVRPISEDEAQKVIPIVNDIKMGIAAEKAYYAQQNNTDLDDSFNKM